MNANAKKAYEALIKIGAPALDPSKGWGGHFAISGERAGADNIFYEGSKDLDPDGGEWYDYYELYMGSPHIAKILDEHGLYAEWLNGGVLCVFDA